MEAIRCEDLSKHFGKVAALDGLNLSVEQGEAFTLALFIAQACLDAIEQTRRFRPTNSVQWGGGGSFISWETSDQWPALLTALGCVAVLIAGTWAVFRRKSFDCQVPPRKVTL